MIYYERKEVTRMSLYHLRKIMDMYEDMGVDCEARIFGNEFDQEELSIALGFNHYFIDNSPLSDKFSFAVKTSCESGKDYICWLGSNNLHCYDYMRNCAELLSSGKAYYGSKSFSICTTDRIKLKKFECRGLNVCSSGQFFKTSSLKSINPFKSSMRHNFDGVMNKHMTIGKGTESVVRLSGSVFNCLDVKDGGDMHSWDKYRDNYAKATRHDAEEKFEELRLLLNGFFSQDQYRTSVLGAYLSESAHSDVGT